MYSSLGSRSLPGNSSAWASESPIPTATSTTHRTCRNVDTIRPPLRQLDLGRLVLCLYFGCLVRSLQFGDIDLHHLQHCIGHSLGLFAVRVGGHLRQDLRHDLPGQSELVFQPAALLRGWPPVFNSASQ